MRELIERQIKATRSRMKALGQEVPATGALSYADSEGNSERRNLRSLLKDAQARLTRTQKAATRDDTRERRFAEAEIANRVAVYERQADRFEAEGDYRQARLYREATMTVPEQVYKQFGLAG